MMTRYSVSAVLEGASRIWGGDRVERPAHRLDQSLPATSLSLAEDALYLSESLLYGFRSGE
jgi:hypothetical protein